MTIGGIQGLTCFNNSFFCFPIIAIVVGTLVAIPLYFLIVWIVEKHYEKKVGVN